MDLGQLTPDQLNSLINLIQSSTNGQLQPPVNNSLNSSLLNQPVGGATPPNPQNDSSQSQAHPQPNVVPPSSQVVPPVRPYQSVNLNMVPRPPASMASLGHPLPSSSAAGLPPPDHFLGLSTLGIDARGHVNRQRLASSAARSPMQPRLPARSRRRRGPAEQPPSLPHTPRAQIADCLSNLQDGNGNTVIRLTVKVFPPMVWKV